MQYTISLLIIELEKNNFHPMIRSTFIDGTKGYWIIDTGASKSVFDKSLHSLYKEIEPDGDSEMHSAGISENMIETSSGEIKSILFGKYRVRNFRTALIDLTHINQLYEKYSDKRICGLIGGDFLVKHKAIIDYAKKELRIKK